MSNMHAQQFRCVPLVRVIGAQFAAEGAGEDGFFDEVDLLQYPFSCVLGLLLFGEEVVEDADDFGLLFYRWNRRFDIFYVQ